MLKIAMICMLVATIILAVGVCFSKNKTLTFLLQTLSLISLICLGFVIANYKGNFSGFTILLILSVLPQFLSIFDLTEYLQSKKETLPPKENFEEYLPVKENENEEEIQETKSEKKNHFLNSNGTLLKSIAMLLSAICVGMCGIYLGMETFYGFALGLCIGLALTFLTLIKKKNINPYDALSLFLTFVSIGILIGHVVTVLLYSTTITNILFCVGALVLCTYAVLSTITKSKYNQLLYFIGIICLFATLIV